jgi:glyoxylase-like metal-dependent hydrolase (beta-lactamase superfamily II)
MIKIKAFPFNPFAMNTYVVYDETGEGIIIDAGNYTNDETAVLLNFTTGMNISIKGVWLTHAHIDHIIGAKEISGKYGIPVFAHKDGMFLFDEAESYALSLGIAFKGIPDDIQDIDITKPVTFGNSRAIPLLTPGHVNGSICYYFQNDKVLFSGDVLFRNGIGRTDLPTGDYTTLEMSIRNKLYTLPDDVTVYPGHGPKTSIGFEKSNNPFFQE